MKEEALQCPSCHHVQGDKEATFCAKCRFPLMLIAGKYRLQRLLGEGGFGYVYLAKHIRLHQEAERVVKIIKPEVFRQDPSIGVRFEREVQMTSLLSQKCQHIVRIHDDFGEIPSLGHFYVMEYLEGRAVSSYIADPHQLPPLSWCIHVFSQLCDAMRRAHEGDIVHRDLKPDNLMLISYGDEPNYLKVLDFGIAKPANEDGKQVTQGFVGTPVYMAPELFGAKGTIDFRVDIYAMGIILYELLVGKPPFLTEGNQQTSFFTMLHKHINDAPPSMRAQRPDRNIPEALEQVVFRALNKDPEQRFASALDFKHAVQEAAQGAGLAAVQPLPPATHLAPPGRQPSGEVVLRPSQQSANQRPSGTGLSHPNLPQAPPSFESASVEATKVLQSPILERARAAQGYHTPLPGTGPLQPGIPHAMTPLPNGSLGPSNPQLTPLPHMPNARPTPPTSPHPQTTPLPHSMPQAPPPGFVPPPSQQPVPPPQALSPQVLPQQQTANPSRSGPISQSQSRQSQSRQSQSRQTGTQAPKRSAAKNVIWSVLSALLVVGIGGAALLMTRSPQQKPKVTKKAPNKRAGQLPSLPSLPASPKQPKTRKAGIPVYHPEPIKRTPTLPMRKLPPTPGTAPKTTPGTTPGTRTTPTPGVTPTPRPSPTPQPIRTLPQPRVQPLPQRPVARPPRRRRVRRRYRRRVSLARDCPPRMRGLKWKRLRIATRRARVQIINGNGKIKRIRGGYCVWFQAHRIGVNITAAGHKPCQLWIYQLFRKRRLTLKRNGQAPSARNYCTRP